MNKKTDKKKILNRPSHVPEIKRATNYNQKFYSKFWS